MCVQNMSSLGSGTNQLFIFIHQNRKEKIHFSTFQLQLSKLFDMIVFQLFNHLFSILRQIYKSFFTHIILSMCININYSTYNYFYVYNYISKKVWHAHGHLSKLFKLDIIIIIVTTIVNPVMFCHLSKSLIYKSSSVVKVRHDWKLLKQFTSYNYMHIMKN